MLSEDRSRLIDKEFEPTFSEIGQTLSRLTLPGNAGNRARELIVDAFDIAKWAGYGAMERFDIHFDVVKERLEQATTKIALEPEKLKEINNEVARLSTLPTDGPPDQPGQIPAGAGIKPISVKDAQQLMHSIVRIRSVLGEFVRNRDITGRIPAELLHDGDTSDSEPPIKRRRTRENQKNRTSPATDCVEPTGANSGGNDVGDDGLDQRPRSREGTSRG